MEEEIDFWKYHYKYFKLICDKVVAKYECAMERTIDNEYVPVLLYSNCIVAENVSFGNTQIKLNINNCKQYFPEYNSNVIEITKEEYIKFRDSIKGLEIKEAQLKADVLRLYLKNNH